MFSTCKRKVVGSDPARIEKICRPLVHQADTRVPLVEYKVDTVVLVIDSGTKCALQTHVHNTFAAASTCLGCLVALKIWAPLFKASLMTNFLTFVTKVFHQENIPM